MRGKHLIRKPDPLILLAVVVTLFALISTTAQAAEPFQFEPQSRFVRLTAGFDENGYRLTGMGKSAAGLHISMNPPPDVEKSYRASGAPKRGIRNQSDVFLSIRLPW